MAASEEEGTGEASSIRWGEGEGQELEGLPRVESASSRPIS